MAVCLVFEIYIILGGGLSVPRADSPFLDNHWGREGRKLYDFLTDSVGGGDSAPPLSSS